MSTAATNPPVTSGTKDDDSEKKGHKKATIDKTIFQNPEFNELLAGLISNNLSSEQTAKILGKQMFSHLSSKDGEDLKNMINSVNQAAVIKELSANQDIHKQVSNFLFTKIAEANPELMDANLRETRKKIEQEICKGLGLVKEAKILEAGTDTRAAAAAMSYKPGVTDQMGRFLNMNITVKGVVYTGLVVAAGYVAWRIMKSYNLFGWFGSTEMPAVEADSTVTTMSRRRAT